MDEWPSRWHPQKPGPCHRERIDSRRWSLLESPSHRFVSARKRQGIGFAVPRQLFFSVSVSFTTCRMRLLPLPPHPRSTSTSLPHRSHLHANLSADESGCCFCLVLCLPASLHRGTLHSPDSFPLPHHASQSKHHQRQARIRGSSFRTRRFQASFVQGRAASRRRKASELKEAGFELGCG